MTSIAFTTFQNVGAQTAAPVKEDWPAFIGRFKDPKEYRDKKAMPLLSLCEYGKKRSAKGSLRHSGNIKAVHGIEIDYDGEKVSPENARKRLAKAGVKAVIYTTPSHKPNKPRWRALLPLSKPVSADERHRLVGKANRALGGIATRESFSPSQSFYFGKDRKAKGYRCYTTEGKCVDRVKLKPLGPPDYKGGTSGAFDDIPDDVFIEAFEKGEGRYNAALALTSRWIAKGRDPEKVRKELHKYVRLAEHDGVDPHTTQGENLYKAISRLVDSARDKYGKEAAKRKKAKKAKERKRKEDTQADSKFHWKDASQVMATEPVPPQFLIDGWLPFPNVTIYCAHGGTGKSFVALEIAVRVALGISVFGRETKRKGPVLYVSAEDDMQVMHWRLSKICKALKIPKAKLQGKLFLSDATEADTVLFAASGRFGDGQPESTERFTWLQKAVERYRPVLVVLDSAVDHFSGNENDRAQVRPFVRRVGSLKGIGGGCSILLLAHVDAASVKDPEKAKGFSGSTAWPNASRSHWYARRDGEEITLELRKSNYEKPGLTASYRWNDVHGKFDLSKTKDGDRAAFDYGNQILRVIASLESEGARLCPDTASHSNIVPQVLEDHRVPESLRRQGKAVMKKLIRTLRQEGHLVPMQKEGKSRGHQVTVLTLSDGARTMLRESDELE